MSQPQTVPIIECDVNHPALPQLFDPHVPNNPSLWASFQGRLSSQALVDNLQAPTQCLVRTRALLTYASRRVSPEFLSEAVRYFRRSSRLWLVRNPGDPPISGDYTLVPRIEFYDYDPCSDIMASLRNRIPDGFQLRIIDKDLLERCEWRDDMAFYCGSKENFLLNGIGLCIMCDDQIIVEAYASALGSPYAEIGAITHRPYRGRGYAPIAVACLIDVLEQRGYHAYWSCDVDNPASAQVARKLGFKIERSYEIFDYEKEK